MRTELRRRLGSAAAFALAAASYAAGLSAQSVSWLLFVAASLTLLTVGFFLLEGGRSRRGSDDPEALDSGA